MGGARGRGFSTSRRSGAAGFWDAEELESERFRALLLPPLPWPLLPVTRRQDETHGDRITVTTNGAKLHSVEKGNV